MLDQERPGSGRCNSVVQAMSHTGIDEHAPRVVTRRQAILESRCVPHRDRMVILAMMDLNRRQLVREVQGRRSGEAPAHVTQRQGFSAPDEPVQVLILPSIWLECWIACSLLQAFGPVLPRPAHGGEPI